MAAKTNPKRKAMSSARRRVDGVAERRWQAVLGRAPDADGRFVYAVRSTGIYCRPTCPSARPLRRNVEFFADARGAARAGYRACKRCRPDDAAGGPVPATLRAACARLASEAPVGTAMLARELGLSPSYFQRFFRQHLGITPQAYRRRWLAERARRALPAAPSVSAFAFQAGYGSSSRFYANLGAELGMKPSVARRGAPGELIAYSVAPCSLGHVCIAWTARGVCDVSLGGEPVALVSELERRYGQATLHACPAHPWARAVIASVERALPSAVPLDIRGTAFQARVWAALA